MSWDVNFMRFSLHERTLRIENYDKILFIFFVWMCWGLEVFFCNLQFWVLLVFFGTVLELILWLSWGNWLKWFDFELWCRGENSMKENKFWSEFSTISRQNFNYILLVWCSNCQYFNNWRGINIVNCWSGLKFVISSLM